LAILTSRKAPPDLQKSPSRPPEKPLPTSPWRGGDGGRGDSGEEGVSG